MFTVDSSMLLIVAPGTIDGPAVFTGVPALPMFIVDSSIFPTLAGF